MGTCDESLALDGPQPFSLCHGETPHDSEAKVGSWEWTERGPECESVWTFQVRWAAVASGKTAFSVFQQPGRRGRAAGRVPVPLSLNSQRSPSPSSSVSVWSNRAAKTSVSGSLSSPRAIPAPPPRETHQLGEPQGVVEAKRLHRCRKPRPERARPAFPSPQALFHSPPPHLPFLSFQEQWRDGVDLTQVKRPGSGALSPGASAFQVSRLPCPHPPPPTFSSVLRAG